MGFQRQAYKLKWPEGSRWHGLEVRLRGMDLGELREISSLQSSGGETDSLEKVEGILDILGRALLSWNFEDEGGKPVPIKSFRTEDMAMLLAILNAWQEAVGNVPTPLPQTSSDGGKLEEESIPMEIPSSSHPNLNTPN